MAPRAGDLLLFYWFGYFQVKIGNNSVVFELGEEFRGLKSRFWSIETAFFNRNFLFACKRLRELLRGFYIPVCNGDSLNPLSPQGQ